MSAPRSVTEPSAFIHTVEEGLLAGIADDIPLKVWLEEHIWPREGRFVAPEFVYLDELESGTL